MMKDERKTKAQLIKELNELRKQLTAADTQASELESDDSIDDLFKVEEYGNLISESKQKIDQYIYKENQEVVNFLKNSRLFSHLPGPLLKQLNPLSDFEEYAEGQEILVEGEKNTKIFFLISGSVGIYAGNEFILSLQRKGDIFGEMSSISGKPCSATVRATSPIRVFSIKAREIGKYTDINTNTLQHTFYRLFAMILTEKLAVTTHKAQQYEVTHRKMLKEIAERRQVEVDLLNYRDSLKRMVDERTQDLTVANKQLQKEIHERQLAEENRLKLEEQLRQSQKMEAIGTLAGGIAHDFNNILGTMLGFTRLSLDQQEKDNPVVEYLEEVYKAGERASDLVSQLLTFSRIGDPDLRPSQLSPIVNGALKMMRATLPTNIEILQDNRVVEGCVLVNATQIHQVIINLCSNASYAMAETGGKLNIHVDCVSFDEGNTPLPEMTPSKEYVQLTISDTGRGIPPDVIDRIFDPFFTTKGIGEGSGLGLSVVHGIVINHQGHILVESDPAQGTSFHIFFPRVYSKPDDQTDVTTQVTTGNEHILIVEDEGPLAKFYQIALGKLGYQVTIAHNGDDALEKFRQAPDQFDLVFTDQAMPVLTGAQLSQAIIEIRPDTPIILATGYSSVLSESEAIEIGIKKFIMKPVKLNILTDAIREILAGDS